MARSPIVLWWDAACAGYNLMARAAETMIASAEVIAHRTSTIQAAYRNPSDADYPELARMVAEKTDAFTRANLMLMRDLGDANADLVAAMLRLGLGQGISCEALAGQGARLSRRTNRIAERALRPIHARATANARRLSRKNGSAG